MKTKNLFLLFLIPLIAFTQITQIGLDIDGEVADDYLGNTSLNSDGSIVAIGTHYNDGNGDDSGHVRVYQNTGGVWTQIGEDIDGEDQLNYSGLFVSLNADGSILAIGATWNDGNESRSGHVRIYENTGSDTYIIPTSIGFENDIDRREAEHRVTAHGLHLRQPQQGRGQRIRDLIFDILR